MLVTARRLITGLKIANWIAAVAFIAVLGMFLANPAFLGERLADAFGDRATLFRLVVIGILAIGIAVCVAAHVMFGKLLAIIASVRAGRPFAGENADRLRHIAWALLAIQLLDLMFGLLSWWWAEATGETMGWTFSLTGWISVVLLFVLARIFQQGAIMQEELEATV